MAEIHENEYKEVDFHKYCGICEFKNMKDADEPCSECLDNPINLYSHKPVKFKEEEK